MKTELIHRYGDSLEFYADRTCLFRYNYDQDKVSSKNSPKPWFHPLQSIAGDTVSLNMPHDHRWHQGLAMTFSEVSGSNFWGGPTFLKGKGYQAIENHGSQIHVYFDSIQPETAGCSFEERLKWMSHAGELLFDETRQVRAAIHPEEDAWSMRLQFRLTNVSRKKIEFGSPTTAGRPNAGYGSLFWRGPRSWLSCAVSADGGLEGEEAIMGNTAPWLAFTGAHDGVARSSTIIFVDMPGNPRYPTKWFCRTDPFACASFAFMFDEVYELEPNAELSLSYAIIIANGSWDRTRIGKESRTLQQD